VAAERDLPPGDTSAGLYRLLLDDFVRRELARPDNQAAGLTDDERRAAELWKLGLVAFGMLNRGQQHLHEHDLAADLRALPGPVPVPPSRGRDVARTLDPARRVIGRFFFVHTAEAAAGEGGRSYEFLHATFADYLIAQHTVDLLRDAAAARRLRTASQAFDDDLLFALLSHTLVVGFGSHTIKFFAELTGGDADVAAVLEHLLGAAQDRWGRGRHAEYDPSGLPVVRRLATYSANLTAMRLAMASEPVPLKVLCPPGANVRTCWQSQMYLWNATLADSPQWGAFLSNLRVDEGEPPTVAWRRWSGYWEDMLEIAALNESRALRLAAGRALLSGIKPGDTMDQPGPATARDLAALLRQRILSADELSRLTDICTGPSQQLVELTVIVAALHGADLSTEAVDRLLAYLPSAAVPAGSLVELLVRHPEAVKHSSKVADTQTFATDMAFHLATLISPWSRKLERSPLDGTPEALAAISLPPDLARRLIPELVASLYAKERDAR
jgi:hypothetical protein